MPNLAPQSLPMRIERLAGGRVKGSAISARLDWVRDHASREETIELFEALPLTSASRWPPFFRRRGMSSPR